MPAWVRKNPGLDWEEFRPGSGNPDMGRKSPIQAGIFSDLGRSQAGIFPGLGRKKIRPEAGVSSVLGRSRDGVCSQDFILGRRTGNARPELLARKTEAGVLVLPPPSHSDCKWLLQNDLPKSRFGTRPFELQIVAPYNMPSGKLGGTVYANLSFFAYPLLVPTEWRWRGCRK